jgi:hypothetical protein
LAKLKTGLGIKEIFVMWITCFQVVKIGAERKSFLNGFLNGNSTLFSPSDCGKTFR